MLASVPRGREQLLDQIRETTLEALRSHRGVVDGDDIVDDSDEALRDIVAQVMRLVDHAIELAAALRGRRDPAKVAEAIAQIASTTAQAIAGLLSQLSFLADLDDVVDTFRDVVEAAIIAGTDATGGASDLDGDPFSMGLVALWKLAKEYSSRDPSNLQRRISEAERLGQTRKAARLTRVQRRVLARQARRKS